MKRFRETAVACILAACLLLAVIPVQASDDTLQILLAADTHYYSAEDLGDMTAQYTQNMLDSELYYYASSQGQMNYESRAVAQAMLDDFVSGDVPYLLIAGDLTGGRHPVSNHRFPDRLRAGISCSCPLSVCSRFGFGFPCALHFAG